MKITVLLDSGYDDLAEKFIRFSCKELCILPRRIHVESFDIEGSNGMCIDEEIGSFVILIKNNERDLSKVFTTLAHEMVHVKQYMTDNLGTLLDKEKETPYLDRWWEMEAAEKAVPLVEKFAKSI